MEYRYKILPTEYDQYLVEGENKELIFSGDVIAFYEEFRPLVCPMKYDTWYICERVPAVNSATGLERVSEEANR